MSWCPTGPKSTYLLFPRPHNGTGCYVNESVPELIYALLNFMGVGVASREQILKLSGDKIHPGYPLGSLKGKR